MTPIEILAAIESGALLPPRMFEGVDGEAVVDALDDPEYEAEWVRLKDAVDHAWEEASPGPVVRRLADRIQKYVFLAATKASRNHLLATYIAHDFDLIVRARVAGLADPFLERLWATYQAHDLPSPSLAKDLPRSS
jgi:hypothetical protein